MVEAKIPPNSWQCDDCTTINHKLMPHCEACNKQLPTNKGNPYVDDVLINAQNQIYLQQHGISKTQSIDTNDGNWECKICSMKNSKYMPRCEMCLIDRFIQQNDELLKQFIQTNSKNNGHIMADDILVLLQKFQDELTKFQQNKQKIQKELESIYAKMNIDCDPKLVEKFIESLKVDGHDFDEQKELNKKCVPICKCGKEMISKKSTKCYNSNEYFYVQCDICDKKIPENKTVFHCPRKKIKTIHPHGFDICLSCRKNHIHRLRYFVAFIICPRITKQGNKDAVTLIKMFNKLGFHKIICLENEQVTRESVQKAFKEILPENNDNINQFTVICYSGHGAYYNDKYSFAIDHQTRISAEEMRTWSGATVVEATWGSQLQAMSKSAMDGLKQYFNQYWHKKHYKYNTLWLINSCHAGGFKNGWNPAGVIARSFVSVSLVPIVFMIFNVTVIYVATVIKGITDVFGKSIMKCINGLCGDGGKECLKECLKCGLSPRMMIGIAIAAGVSIVTVIIVCFTVYKAIKKSEDSESTYVIASCQMTEESIAAEISPFIKHCDKFFDIFLQREKNEASTPEMLYKYLQNAYKTKDNDLGGIRLMNGYQNVCQATRGFKQFAIFPKFHQT